MALSFEHALRRAVRRLLLNLSVALRATACAGAQTSPRGSAATPRPATAVTAPAPRPSPVTNADPAPLAREFSARDFARQHAEQQSTSDAVKTLKTSLFQTTKTPFMTESRLPLTRLAGSRLGLNFDVSSTSNRSVMMGPLVPGQTTEWEFAQGRTDDRYGVSLSVPLRRGADAGASKGLFAGVARVFRQTK